MVCRLSTKSRRDVNGWYIQIEGSNHANVASKSFWAIPGLFFFFFYFCLFYTVKSKQNVLHKRVPMTGFELRTSGVGSDCSTN